MHEPEFPQLELIDFSPADPSHRKEVQLSNFDTFMGFFQSYCLVEGLKTFFVMLEGSYFLVEKIDKSGCKGTYY